jgi:hypothetical protein
MVSFHICVIIAFELTANYLAGGNWASWQDGTRKDGFPLTRFEMNLPKIPLSDIDIDFDGIVSNISV